MACPDVERAGVTGVIRKSSADSVKPVRMIKSHGQAAMRPVRSSDDGASAAKEERCSRTANVQSVRERRAQLRRARGGVRAMPGIRVEAGVGLGGIVKSPCGFLHSGERCAGWGREV